MSDPAEMSFEEFQGWSAGLREKLMEAIERYTGPVAANGNLVAYVLIELGARLLLVLHGPELGATMARQHVEAVIALAPETDPDRSKAK